MRSPTVYVSSVVSATSIAAFVLAIVAIGVLVVRFDLLGGGASRPHVARISVKGVMLPDQKLVDLIDGLAGAKAVEGVIVDIDSPGGATSAGEALYGALRRLSEKKPTVAWVGTLGASAGYMTALGTDHIVTRRTALVGSIGVLAQWPDVTKLMDTVGVKYETIKSSPMKPSPSPFEPTSPQARAMLDRAIRDTYDWFVDLVAERRGLARDRALELADGRVVTGHQALTSRLVDEIGEESVAQAWLVSKGLPAGLPILDHRPKSDGTWAWAGAPLRRSPVASPPRSVSQCRSRPCARLTDCSRFGTFRETKIRVISRGSGPGQVGAGGPVGRAQSAPLPA